MKRLLSLFTCLIFLCLHTTLTAADYYWVGGSGNWSDISHWATTSGGTTFHNQAPTSNDNVFFDANSFTAPAQTVTINTDNAFCRDMNWTGATGTPVLAGTADRVLTINGSLQFIPDMTFGFAGDVSFKGAEPGLQIDPAGHPLPRNVLFSGGGAEWTLQSALAVDSLLLIEGGTLNTNDQPLQCAYLYIRPNQPTALQLTGSTVSVTGQTFFINFLKYPVVHIQNNNFSLDAGNSTIDLTAADVDVIVEGNNPSLDFHLVRFTEPAGNTYLQVYQPSQLTFDSLLFSNGAEILGSMQFDYLELAPGKGYSFESYLTYTIGELSAAGRCEAPIQILASSAGEAVNFNVATEPVNITYVSLKDIHAGGGASFTADNSADLGNNNGWTINAGSMNDLYWVGGSGDWDDPAHWAFTSGGPGGACVPTGADNVYFDANSFPAPGQTVNITLDNALCRNMDWTGAAGNPILVGKTTQNIRIFGSLTFIPNMQIRHEGEIYLQASEPGQTVTTGNHLFTRSVTFDGDGGEWILQDSLQAVREIFLIKGHLNTNNQTVVTHGLKSERAFTRQLTLGNSHIYLRDYDFNDQLYWPNFRIESNNLIFDAGTSTIEYLTYGEHVVSGGTPVAFHKVIFDTYGIVSLWEESDVYIDSLAHHESAVYFGGECHIGTWLLDGGYEYLLSDNQEYTIDRIVLNNNCNRLVYVHSRTNGLQVSIRSDNPITVEYLQVKDVINSGANDFIANNSVDLGNNQNLTINEQTPRTLYWVGDGGPWSDPIHWSLTSGGPGGECIPTAVDDVIFDENSFSTPGHWVWSEYPQNYCHDMTWRDVTNTPSFGLGDMLVFGSLEFNENMEVYLGGLRFSGRDDDNTIDTKGRFVGYTNFEGSGTYRLLNSYQGHSLNLSGGTWNTNGFPVNLVLFHCYGFEVEKGLILGNSHLTLSGSQETIGVPALDLAANLQIDAGTSLIEFTGTNPTMGLHHHLSGSHTFHNILFSAEEGQSLLDPRADTKLFINRLQFNNDGIINSENTIDSLIFTAGKSYQLQAERTQTLNEYWQIIGNNCLSIELSSTVPGLKSTTTMANGQVDGDFIQMRDQIATGGAAFYAGTHSTDIGGSNTGWIFDSAEDFVEVGFLGEDRVLCNNTSIVVDADNRSPSETYVWSDGSTGSSIEISATGSYWAEVSFTDNCTIRDSILVFEPQDFTTDLGPDAAICAGDTLVLDATVDALGIQYRWQDGSDDPTFPVTAAGEYKVELELSGCTFRDSIQVEVKPLPSFDLGANLTICAGDLILVGGDISPNATYLWSDGSTEATLGVRDPDLYWLEATIDGCSRRDSITVDTKPSPVIDLGADRELCNGENEILDATNDGATYLWQDGSTAPTLNAVASGQYEVTVDLNGCVRQGAVELTFKPLPVFELGDDQTPCEGETVNLDGTVPGATYDWNTGSAEAAIDVTADGRYRLIATLDGCDYRDSVQVTYQPNPVIALGADRELCDGENEILDATNDGATYLWQDGSTAPTLNAVASGQYEVTVDLNGCVRQGAVELTFKPLPVFELGDDQTPCEGETVNLDGTVPGATYDWNTGSTEAAIDVTADGRYRLIATLDGCDYRDSVRVTYQPNPVVDLGADRELCDGENEILDAANDGATYLWQDGSTSPTLNATASGQYEVTVDLNGCVRESMVELTFKPLPVFELGDDQTPCEGETVNLDGTVPGATYTWNTGSATAAIDVTTDGLYRLIANLDGCSYRDSVTVTYIVLPKMVLGADQTRCEGETALLDASFNDAGYLWQDGSTAPTFTVSQEGEYWVAVRIGNCEERDSVVFTYNPTPRFNLGADLLLCEDEGQTFSLSPEADTYRWQDGSTGSSLTVGFPGGTIWGEVSQDGCSFRDTVQVTYRQFPQLDLGPDTLICADEPFVLTVGNVAGQIRWQDGSTAATYQVNGAGAYSVEVTDGPCVSTDEVVIATRDCIYFELYMPNAFSPNEDGENDLFQPYIAPGVQILEYKFSVFDRWGNQLFLSGNPDEGWDGAWNGRQLSAGVYVYFVELEYMDERGGGTEQFSGDVVLIR